MTVSDGQRWGKPLGKHPESECYFPSGLPSCRPLGKYPESEFDLSSGLPSSRLLCKYLESESYFPSGLPSSRPSTKEHEIVDKCNSKTFEGVNI